MDGIQASGPGVLMAGYHDLAAVSRSMRIIPSEEERRSAEIHAIELDCCEDLVHLREVQDTQWLKLPTRSDPGAADLDRATCKQFQKY